MRGKKMNLTQIQAVEYIIHDINPNQKLVVDYNGRLLTADFLDYFDSSVNIGYTGQKEPFEKMNNTYFIHYVLGLYEITSSEFEPNQVRVDGRNYTMNNISADLLRDLILGVQTAFEEHKDKKPFLNHPQNVNFLDTNIWLPFYLFPEDASLTIVSIIDNPTTKN